MVTIFPFGKFESIWDSIFILIFSNLLPVLNDMQIIAVTFLLWKSCVMENKTGEMNNPIQEQILTKLLDFPVNHCGVQAASD